jgi:hypothetical protein
MAQLHLMRGAATGGLVLRHSTNLIVAAVSLADPNSVAPRAGKLLLIALALWSVHRLATRSRSAVVTAADYGWTLAICAVIPLLAPGPHLSWSTTTPEAVGGTAVVSFAAALPARLTFPMAMGVAAAYAWGVARDGDPWQQLPGTSTTYYFLLQWAFAALIRLMLIRIAKALDESRRDREAAEVSKRITEALRDLAREHLSLLHDTAASTLFTVAEAVPVRRERLAAQARRDLQVLRQEPWMAAPARAEVVAALREGASHLQTPVHFTGLPKISLDGDSAKAILAAAREVMNNVDRHSQANKLTVDIRPDRIILSDDGVGFIPSWRAPGHGLADSVVARMSRSGGTAKVISAPGRGTVVELAWARQRRTVVSDDFAEEAERLIKRGLVGFGLALTAYAVANLAATVPYSTLHTANATPEIVLAGLTALSTLAAIPGLLYGKWRLAWPAAMALLVTVFAQPALNAADFVGGHAHWSLYAIGWCLLPLLLGLGVRKAAVVLSAYWALTTVHALARHPSAHAIVDMGVLTASVFAVQLFALLFSVLLHDAASEVFAEARAHQALVTKERVAEAVRSDYRRRRDEVARSVIPLLEELTTAKPVDTDLRRRAQSEYQRLRILFDHAATAENPLLPRLWAAVSAAEHRHVEVTVDVDKDLPEIPAPEAEHVVMSIQEVLDSTDTSARIVLTATPAEFSASIISEGHRGETPELDRLATDDVDIEVTSLPGKMWLTVRRRLLDGAGNHAFS